MKLDNGGADPQSISNTIWAYSKSQNGSEQFYRIMEQHIIKHKDEFNCQELANLLYSYFKAEYATSDVLRELIPTVIS